MSPRPSPIPSPPRTNRRHCASVHPRRRCARDREKAAVLGGGMRDDAFAIEPRLLGCSPRGRRAGLDIATIENGELSMMLGALFDKATKSRLAIDESAEAVKIPTRPALRRRRQAGGIGDTEALVLRRQREKGDVGDARGQPALGGAMERGLNGLRRHGDSPQNAKTRRERRAGMEGVGNAPGDWSRPALAFTQP